MPYAILAQEGHAAFFDSILDIAPAQCPADQADNARPSDASLSDNARPIDASLSDRVRRFPWPSPESELECGIALLKCFLRANVTGPPIQSEESLPRFLKNDDEDFLRAARNALSLEGELVQELMSYPQALLLSLEIFDHLNTEPFASMSRLPLWRSRAALAHQKSLVGGRRNPLDSLKQRAVFDLVDFLKKEQIIPLDFHAGPSQIKSASRPAREAEHSETSKIAETSANESERTLDVSSPSKSERTLEVSSPSKSQRTLEVSSPRKSERTLDVSSPDKSTDTSESRSFSDRLLCLELAAALASYGLTTEWRNLTAFLATRMGFAATLTGRLGIRREFQQDSIAQLVLDVKSTKEESTNNSQGGTTSEHQKERISSDSAKENASSDSAKENAPDNDLEQNASPPQRPQCLNLQNVDPTTDVLENPKFVDAEEKGEEWLSIEEQLYLLSWSNLILETCSKSDEMSLEMVQAIVRETLRLPEGSAGSNDWLIFSYGLWLRSLSEFHRTKLRERSCLQMLSLEDQFRDPAPSAEERLRFVWQLDYPDVWEVRHRVGRKFMELGATLTAKKMFEEMRMWDEAVRCLHIAGRLNEARELVKAKLEEQPSPALYCSLGDLNQDESAYIKAWEMSGHHFGRAARSLGRLFYDKGNRGEALRWFSKSLALRPNQSSAQFTYGCCLMQEGRFEEALNAFGVVVRLEPEQGDAWANLAAIHTKLDQWDAAKRCIATAARNNGNSWRVWDSYFSVAAKTDDIYAAIESLEHLVTLDQTRNIGIWQLNWIVRQCMKKADALKTSICEIEHRDSSVEEKEKSKEGLRLGLRMLLERSLTLFQNFFLKWSPQLPSSVGYEEPLSACVDRYRVWGLMTSLVQFSKLAWEIKLKQLRHLLRVFEDVATKLPARASDQAFDQSFQTLTSLLAASINELLSQSKPLKELLVSDSFSEEFRTTSRFLSDMDSRMTTAVSNSPHSFDRHRVVSKLTQVFQEAQTFLLSSI